MRPNRSPLARPSGEVPFRRRSSGLRRAAGPLRLLAVAPALLLPLGCAGAQAAPPAPPGRVTGPPMTPAPASDAGTPSIRMVWEELGLLPAGALQDGSSVLNVSGRGEVQAPPDRASLSFAVETEATTARAAGENNAAQMDALIRALRSQGGALPGFRVETSGYSLSPRYAPSRDDRPPTIVGYVARNSLVLSVDQVTGLGPVIDTALSSGANRASGISFGVQDPEPYRHEALRLAVASARAEAEVIAEALGMRLGPPIEVHGGAEPVFRPTQAESRGVSFEAQVATPIEAGLRTLTADVSIRFRLDPAP